MTNFMASQSSGRSRLFSIGAAERDTGISKDTLRAWERRYGFPKPQRNPDGERVYTQSQIRRLQLIKQLIDRHHRPGRIVDRHPRDLERLISKRASGPAKDGGFSEFMAALKSHDVESLQRYLKQRLMLQGLERFVIDTVAPLNLQVGESWALGQLAVHEEHLYAQQIENNLRHGLFLAPHRRGAPRVLLTSMPGEQHRIGLLMAEVLFIAAGARCTALGTETPIDDIVLAARAHRIDIVALSFSAAFPPGATQQVLGELRAKLPPSNSIWAGGQGLRDEPEASGVEIVRDLYRLRPMLSAWRAAHLPAPVS